MILLPAGTPPAGIYPLEAEARNGGPASIYRHVPFCRSICNDRGWTTRATRRDDPLRSYAELLKDEIRLHLRLGRGAILTAARVPTPAFG